MFPKAVTPGEIIAKRQDIMVCLHMVEQMSEDLETLRADVTGPLNQLDAQIDTLRNMFLGTLTGLKQAETTGIMYYAKDPDAPDTGNGHHERDGD